jgi:spore maturation protein SpmB
MMKTRARSGNLLQCAFGAKDGFTIAVWIIPYLVAILVTVGMFRASGALIAVYICKLLFG